MHELLPHIPQQLTHILGNLIYFIPELYLVALFMVVIVTDLIFGATSAKLCRLVALAGMVIVAFKDINQFALVGGRVEFLFSGMLLNNAASILFRLVIDCA